jgi:hypothetical protein
MNDEVIVKYFVLFQLVLFFNFRTGSLVKNNYLFEL